MPLYEYQCESCGTRLELLQSFNDPAPASCECGEEGTFKRLISAPAFQFKGDGWYVTDYARKDEKKKKEAESAKSSETKSSETKSSETKSSETKSSDTKSSETKSSSKSESSSKSTSSSKPTS